VEREPGKQDIFGLNFRAFPVPGKAGDRNRLGVMVNGPLPMFKMPIKTDRGRFDYLNLENKKILDMKKQFFYSRTIDILIFSMSQGKRKKE
jgi:hypothetical protein